RRRRGIAQLYNRFFKWYVPFFRAYSLVLARGNEYDADQLAARVTTPRISADALINVELYGVFYDEVFIGKLEEKVRIQEEVPAYYTALQQAFRECSAEAELDQYLERALK